MGHRTLVAYEVSQDVYDLHFSRWGAKEILNHDFSSAKPYGGESSSPGYASGVINSTDAENEAGAMTDAQLPTEISQTPRKSNVPLHEAVTEINYLHDESFHIISQDWSKRSFVVVPYLGGTPGEASSMNGALIECNDTDTYSKIFSRTRTEPWKVVNTKSEWRSQLKEDYSGRIPSFSPEP